MAFINQDRTSSIQSDRLNLKQTPADIWEYDDANTDSTPTLSLKSPWKFSGEFRPPIGIPTFWFSSLPDWAIAFDDGSGPYDWDDYPELDNATFKAMLTIWSNAGWMSAYDGTSFYVPDLKGLFPRISGTNAIRSTVYAGGNLAAYLAHQFQIHVHNHRHSMGVSTDDHYHGSAYPRTSNDYSSTNYTDYTAANPSSGNYGSETRPGSFSLRLIVRFE